MFQATSLLSKVSLSLSLSGRSAAPALHADTALLAACVASLRPY